jgi:hypothetical protein
MKRWFPPAGIAIAAIAVCVLVAVLWRYKLGRAAQVRFERRETELVIANLARVPLRLYKAGKNPGDAQPVVPFNGERIWLPAGDYFLKANYRSREVFYPVPVAGYRCGPDANGSFAITIRTLTDEAPPSTSPIRDNWALVTSGNFLYRDSFQPEVSNHDLGFRIVARPLP